MTRPQIVHCDNPNCPHEKLLKFSQWVRVKLPDSKLGQRAYDIDWIFWKKEGYDMTDLMIVEVKTHNTQPLHDERMTYRFINNCIDWSIRFDSNDEFKYHGYHEIIFENTFFDDGKVYLDGNEITEQDLIKFLSFT